MSDWREPETYNSQGLVSKVDSLNSSEANLINQPGFDSSLNSSFEQSVPQLFFATSNGLHPSLITEMFQSSRSPKQLTQFLISIFSHGLKTGHVDISLSLAKQCHHHKYYHHAVVNSVGFLTQSHVRLTLMGNMVALIINVYQMLGPEKDILTPVLVDTLVKWISPLQDRKKEVMMATSAKFLISKAGREIGLSSLSGYKLVYAQVKAGLLGEGLIVESRAVLLDMVVIMSRQGMPGDVGVMFLDEHDQKNDDEKSVENKDETITEQVQIGKLETVVLGDVEEIKTVVEEHEKELLLKAGFVCSFAADVENLKITIKKDSDEMTLATEKSKEGEVDQQSEYEKVQLFTPAMFEETASQAAPPVSESHPTLLGHFEAMDTETVYPVYDNQCSIGRDSSCSIVLPGKEVSRLHARVSFSEGKVSMESVSKTNNIRINGVAVNKAATLMNWDRIHVGRAVLIWHKEGAKQQEKVSEDTLWGERENDSSENCFKAALVISAAVEEIEDEANHDRYLEFNGDKVSEKVVSDTESVVVEMGNFV